jgi:hypothetical protein
MWVSNMLRHIKTAFYFYFYFYFFQKACHQAFSFFSSARFDKPYSIHPFRGWSGGWGTRSKPGFTFSDMVTLLGITQS